MAGMLMKVLLTNDDGIDASGLQALHDSIRFACGDAVDILVVAPDRGRSECGHSVTTRRPLKIEERQQGWISVDGTPVDCVRVALGMMDRDFDLVLSGVNAGANLGIDLLVSGTFAAAREAAVSGIPAMAVSHYRRPDVPATWDHVPAWLTPTLHDFCRRVEQVSRSRSETDNAMLWNVNLPAIQPDTRLPPVVRCGVDTEPMERHAVLDGKKMRFDSDFHGRPREMGRDVDQCFRGNITISECERPFAL